MFIDRTAFGSQSAQGQRRDSCLDCPDCKGTCLELLQLEVWPDILVNRRGTGR